MATRETQTNNFKYLEVKGHSIVEVSKQGDNSSLSEEEFEEQMVAKGFEKVKVTNPSTGEVLTKYYDRWPGITGYVINVDLYDTEKKYTNRFQGVKINIDNEVILDLPQKTPAYDAFCRAAENIDYSQPVTFAAYHNRAKDRTGFSIKQNGEGVDWNYTMDNMGDCPPWVKNADDEWDSSEQRAFFKARIREVIIPAVKAAADERGVTAQVKPATEEIEYTGTQEEANEVTAETVEAVDAETTEAPKATSKTGKGKGKAATATATPAVNDDDIPF